MKLYLFFLILISIASNYCNQPILGVVLMVKNEESVIGKTLEPFVRAGIDSFLIFDTGSSDNTIGITHQFFKDNHITHYHIFQEPFIDFATSRNRALDLAEEQFPEIQFFIMPDAEWYMHNVEHLIDFCREQAHDSCTCYLIRTINEGIDFTVPRLIKAHTNARFIGVVHEIIVAQAYKKVSPDIYFELGCSKMGFEKSQQRWHRDLTLLLKNYQENPQNTRTTFYLAQTYECLCDYENAYTFYKIRSNQESSWIEENYETFYRLGRVTTILTEQNSNYTWHMAQDYYFKAHNILPHRAEPLIRIAEHYWPDAAAPENIAVCYLFAKRAYELPYPENDLLFIDPEVYNFRRHELLSKSAWHVGDFELGEIATRKALYYRELPYLLRNLACYVEKKQSCCDKQKNL